MQANPQQQHIILTNNESNGGSIINANNIGYYVPITTVSVPISIVSSAPAIGQQEQFPNIQSLLTRNSEPPVVSTLNVAPPVNFTISSNQSSSCNGSPKMTQQQQQQQHEQPAIRLMPTTTTNALSAARTQSQPPPLLMINNNSSSCNAFNNSSIKGTNAHPGPATHVLHNNQLKQRLLVNNIPINPNLAIKKVVPSSSSISNGSGQVVTLQQSKNQIRQIPNITCTPVNTIQCNAPIDPVLVKVQTKPKQIFLPSEEELLRQQQQLQQRLQEYNQHLYPNFQSKSNKASHAIQKKKQQQQSGLKGSSIKTEVKTIRILPNKGDPINAVPNTNNEMMFALGDKQSLESDRSLLRKSTTENNFGTETNIFPTTLRKSISKDGNDVTVWLAPLPSASSVNKNCTETPPNTILLSDDNSDDYDDDESETQDGYGAVTHISNSVILTKAPITDNRAISSRNLRAEPDSVVIMKLPPKSRKSSGASEVIPVSAAELVASLSSQTQPLNTVIPQVAMTSSSSTTTTSVAAVKEIAAATEKGSKQESLLKRKLITPSTASSPAIGMSIKPSAKANAFPETLEDANRRAKRSKSLNVPQIPANAVKHSNTLRLSIPNPLRAEVNAAKSDQRDSLLTVSGNESSAKNNRKASKEGESLKPNSKEVSVKDGNHKIDATITSISTPKRIEPDNTGDVIDLNEDSFEEEHLDSSSENVLVIIENNDDSGGDKGEGLSVIKETKVVDNKQENTSVISKPRIAKETITSPNTTHQKKHDVNKNSIVLDEKDQMQRKDKLRKSLILERRLLGDLRDLTCSADTSSSPSVSKPDKVQSLKNAKVESESLIATKQQKTNSDVQKTTNKATANSLPASNQQTQQSKTSSSTSYADVTSKTQSENSRQFAFSSEANKMVANLKMLSWKDRIGSARGTPIRFQLNEFNLLQIHERCPSRYRIHTAYEKPIYDRESVSLQDKEQSDPLLYLCRRCNCHGPAVDFLAPEFCSWECLRRDRSKQKSWNPKTFHSSGLTPSALPVFKWTLYLSKLPNAVAAPIDLFLNPFPTGPNKFQVGMKVEAIDPDNCSLFCVCTVVEIQGYRLRLTFDGYDRMYDFWVNADSMDLFPPGWCMKTNRILQPPFGISAHKFNWNAYLSKSKAQAAPRQLFTHLNNSSLPVRHSFEVGMYLEAEDLNDTRNICVASVADVLDDRIRVHFDGWEASYDYWVDVNSPYIHPCGWHEGRTQLCVPPEYENLSFTWSEYISQNGGSAAPAELFQPRDPIDFKANMKLEVVDPRNPQLIRPATVVARKGHRLKLHLDLWPSEFCFWLEDDSPDLHPISWCDATGHDLEAPPGFQQKPSELPCTTFGCRGIGNAKRLVVSTHAVRDCCPYTVENWKDDKFEKPRRLDVDDIVYSLPDAAQPTTSSSALSTQTKVPTQNALARGYSKRQATSSNGNDFSSSKKAKLSNGNATTPNSLAKKPEKPSSRSTNNSMKASQESSPKRRDSEDSSLNALSSSNLPPIVPIKLEEEKRTVAISNAASEENCDFKGEILATNNCNQKSDDDDDEKDIKQLKPNLLIARRFLNDYGPRLEQNYELWNMNNESNVCLEKLKHGTKNPLEWSISETSEFVRSIVKSEEIVENFKKEEIDGTALLLLKTDDLVEFFDLKLGPLVKLFSGILKLRMLAISHSQSNEEEEASKPNTVKAQNN